MINGIFTRKPTDKIMRLLAEERQCILVGELDKLPERVAKREALIASLAEAADLGGANEGDLRAIQSAMARNAGLMKAAAEGLKSAGIRLRDIADAQSQLNTYGANGGVTDIGVKTEGVQKRA